MPSLELVTEWLSLARALYVRVEVMKGERRALTSTTPIASAGLSPQRSEMPSFEALFSELYAAVYQSSSLCN